MFELLMMMERINQNSFPFPRNVSLCVYIYIYILIYIWQLDEETSLAMS